jgi:hypothetical protein
MSWLQEIRDGRTVRPVEAAETKYQVNWIVLFIGIFFWWMETKYFGWNMVPGSDAELICDGIALLIQALAFQRVPVRRPGSNT